MSAALERRIGALELSKRGGADPGILLALLRSLDSAEIRDANLLALLLSRHARLRHALLTRGTR